MPTPVPSPLLLERVQISPQAAGDVKRFVRSPLVVAGRPSDPWADYNYKSSPCGLLVVICTAVDTGW